MVCLVLGTKPREDRQGLLLGGLSHGHRLEPPLQSRVLLDVETVLLHGGSPDDTDLPPRQGGLEDVGGIHRPLRRSRPHDGVQLVDEEDEIGTFLHLGHDALQPILELPTVFRPRDHGRDVHRHHPLALQGLGDKTVCDALGQSLHHRRLADTRLSDEARVILAPPGQDADHPLGLPLTADDGIQPPRPCLGCEVAAVPRQGRCFPDAVVVAVVVLPTAGVPASLPQAVTIPRATADRPLLVGLDAPRQGRGGGQKSHHVPSQLLGRYPHPLQEPYRHAVGLVQDRQEQMLGAHVGLSRPPRLGGGILDDLPYPWGHVSGGHSAPRARPRQLHHGGAELGNLRPPGDQELGGDAGRLGQEPQEQML